MLNQKDIEIFEKFVGKENVCTDKAHCITYSYDATRTIYKPDVVIFPRNDEDIKQIIIYCNNRGISVTPRGSGTLFSECPLPCNGGVVLVLEKHMNIIKSAPKERRDKFLQLI